MSLRGRGVLAAVLGVLAIAAPAIAANVGGFDFKPAPAAGRGIMRPIGGDPAYGFVFLHELGWYQAVLPRGSQTAVGATPQSRTFDFPSPQGRIVCGAGAYPEDKGLSFEALQARLPGRAAVWESGVAGMIDVQQRGMLELKDDGSRHVTMLSWSGQDRQNASAYVTVGIVEVPRGTLMFSCTGATLAQSRALVLVFQLAEGAL